MNKKIAIAALEHQLSLIDEEDYESNDVWIVKTSELVKSFLGEKSHHYIAISEFSLAATSNDRYAYSSFIKAAEYKRMQANQMVNDAIDTINLLGLYKPPKGNFISQMPNGWLITTIIAVIIAVSSAGWYVGYNRFDIEKLELYEDSKALEKRLVFISDSLIRHANAKKSDGKESD